MSYAIFVAVPVALAALFMVKISQPRRLLWIRTRDGRTSHNVSDVNS